MARKRTEFRPKPRFDSSSFSAISPIVMRQTAPSFREPPGDVGCAVHSCSTTSARRGVLCGHLSCRSKWHARGIWGLADAKPGAGRCRRAWTLDARSVEIGTGSHRGHPRTACSTRLQLVRSSRTPTALRPRIGIGSSTTLS